MKKKIISIIVALAATLQVFSLNIAYADDNSEKALAVLEKMGVIATEDIENAGQTVSRAKFTYYAAKVLGRADINDKLYFMDLPVEHWANPHISALVEMGVIDLADNGLFNPNAPVTPEQAYKIMLVALGYSKAENMTGYSVNARKAGMFVSCHNSDSLTLNEAAEIIYNAMNIGDIRYFASGQEITDENLEKTTLMSRNNLIETEGTITAVYGASAAIGTEVSSENTAYIDGILYNVDKDVNIRDMVGRRIEFVYQEDNEGDGTILYAKVLNKDDEIHIASDLIEEFDGDRYQLKYYKNAETTKTSSITFPDGIKIIYNGKVYSGRLVTIMNEFITGQKHGDITYIEGTAKQEALLIVRSLRTVVAKGYSQNDEIFFDYYSPVDNFDFKDYDVVSFVNTDGSKANMPTVFVSVLDVAESEDKKTAEVIICDKKVKGALTAMISSANPELEIDGSNYEVTDAVWNKFGQFIKVGTDVTVHLNSMGQIAYIETAKTSGMQPGYIMETYVSNEAEMKFIFKMLTKTGVSKIELADKVELDGTVYKMSDYKQFFLNFPKVTEISELSVTIEPQVVRYELTDEGKISRIDTTQLGRNEVEDKTLKLVYDAGGDSSKSLIYVSGHKRFGMNYMYDSTYTDVFFLPQGVVDGKITINGNEVDVDDNMYSTTGTFSSLTSYSLMIYDYDAENPNAEIIVSQKTPLVNEMNIYMFKGMSKVVDDDNYVVNSIKCIGAGGEKNILIDKSLDATAANLELGDIIIVDTDLQGKKAYRIERYFKGDSLEFDDGENRNVSNPYWYRGTYNLYGDSFIVTARQKVRNVTKGYAYNVTNDVLEVMYEQDNNVSERVNAKNVPVIVYDKNMPKNMVYQGTLSDIDTYKTTGEADLVLTGYYSEAVKCIFVYK